MSADLRKRLEELAEKYIMAYADRLDNEYRVKDTFLAGAEYAYKEAIAMAKEWIKNVSDDYVDVGSWDGWGDSPFLDTDIAVPDFETYMNKLIEK